MKALQSLLPGIIDAVQAADSGSFTAAARILGRTPASVSKNVGALEAQLGLRLFNRTTRQLALTEEGRRFVAEARQGLAMLNNAQALAAPDAQPEGLVRISCGVGFGQRFVVPHLAQIMNRHPLLRIELNLTDTHVDLVRDGFDLGIRGGSSPPPGMVARKVGRVATALVASPRYLRDHGSPSSWRDLDSHQLIEVRFQGATAHPWLFRDGRQVYSLPVHSRLTMSEPVSAVNAALNDLGITQISLHHAWHHLQAKRLVAVLPRQHVPGVVDLAIYYPHRRGLAPRVRVVVDFFLAQLASEPALQGHPATGSGLRQARSNGS